MEKFFDEEKERRGRKKAYIALYTCFFLLTLLFRYLFSTTGSGSGSNLMIALLMLGAYLVYVVLTIASWAFVPLKHCIIIDILLLMVLCLSVF